MVKSVFVSVACSRALNKISCGEVSAISEIYDCLSREIYSLALAIIHDYSYAEDVMQETFIKIIENINTYRKDGNAKAWIMTIARNTSIDMKKRKYRDVNIDFLYELQGTESTENIVTKVAVESALASLNEVDRQIVVLKTMVGLSHRQISEIVELSKDSTEKRYQRALKKLGSLLK